MNNNRILPNVAHVMRKFLVTTETFIDNQIMTLQRYHPVVFCHHRQTNECYSPCDVFSLDSALDPMKRIIDRISYNLFRYLPLFSARVISGKLSKYSVSLIHFHYLVDARYFIALKKLTGLPSIASAYGYDVSEFPKLMGGLGKQYLQLAFRELDYIISMSNDMKQDLIRIGCPEKKIIVHYHGSNTDRFQFSKRKYVNKNNVNILICGSLQSKKAHDIVLRALYKWYHCNRSEFDFHLTIVGDGPLRTQLENQVSRYGWKDRVSFLGHIPYSDSQLVHEYQKADIFVLPSITSRRGDKEGLPGTIVEAMASGLPVVSTYHAGIPELIEHKQNGLLVEERDVDALSDALGQLIEDRGLRESLGLTAAHTAYTKCNLQTKTIELEQIYDNILNADQSRALQP